MAAPDTLILHWSEIALKGGNRSFFERKLITQAKRLLTPLGVTGFRELRGRLIASFSDTNREEVKRMMPFLFGVVHAYLAVKVAPTMEALTEAAIDLVSHAKGDSFKIETNRTDKRFPQTSMQVSAAIGAEVIVKTKKRVDVHSPEVTCHIQILEKEAFVAVEILEGSGGLPVGSQPELLVMLSGGIDSPVAALRMLRRGATISGIHFHSYPFTNRASIDKVKDLASAIAPAQGGMRVAMVAFAEVQKYIVQNAPSELRVILYRRAMFRIASALAKQTKILGLVTGESLGQVASQTVENIAAVNDAVAIPIFRPLIGMNKEEIMDEARTFSTYETSVRPHDDCCSLFMPDRPETRAYIPRVRSVEAQLVDLARLENEALEKAEMWTTP